MDNNIRVMEYVGEDFWGNVVYKCTKTNILYKDITLGSDNPELYGCGNDFDGEPSFPIKNDLEIQYKGLPKRETRENKFNYALLSRLRSDCDYYLGYGNKNAKHLWADTVEEHIEKMKELHNGFSDDGKPEWLSFEQILQYENAMIISN